MTSAVVAGEVLEDLLLGQHIGRAQLAVAPLFLSLLVGQMWLMGLFWLATWPHKLRGVAPLTFAALVLFGLAPLVGSQLNPTSIGNGMLQLNATFLLVSLPAGCLAWLRLRQLADQYERKRFSDAQLLARTWWLVLLMNIALQFFNGEHPWAATGFSAFGLVCFAPVNSWLLARLRPAPLVPEGRTLLLLRTFGYTARTERLFDRVGARWRAFGSVLLIAAPDVTARTIGPGEYLRWLTGRIDDIFITSARDLSERLERLDLAPDPDGRYRFNAFCCRSNTWQATVVELIGRADAVVMDVRGLTPMRHGCEFELQQLAARIHPRRLVLVADRTTDRALLKAAFGPHLAEPRVISISGRNVSPVFEALLEAAA
jgi:hypothetical protein